MRGFRSTGVPVWSWMLGAALLVLFGLATTQLPTTWSAKVGEGRNGTWTATDSRCEHRDCRTVGDFRPDDGGAPLHTIGLAGARTAPIGSVHRAIDPGGWNNMVYRPGDGKPLSRMLWASASFLLLFLGWGWWAVTWARAGGRRRPGQDRPEFRPRS